MYNDDLWEWEFQKEVTKFAVGAALNKSYKSDTKFINFIAKWKNTFELNSWTKIDLIRILK